MCCTLVIKWPRKGFGEPSCDIQVWEVGHRELGLGYQESSILWGELLVLAQGDWVDLNTRV